MPLTLLPFGLAKLVYWISLTFLLIVVLQKLYNQIIVLVALGLLFLKFEKRQQSVLAEMSVLIMFIPLFAFTSKYAFLFSLPLVLYLLSYYKALSAPLKVC
jgi:hypothetical protein